MKNTITQGDWTAKPAILAGMPGHAIDSTQGGATIVAFVYGRNEGSTANAKAIAALPKLIAALQTVPQEPDDLDSADPFEAWAAYRSALQVWQQRADAALAAAGIE